MSRNKLADLNDHLFMQLERLNDDDLTGDKLKQEIERAKAMAIVSAPIIESAKTTVAALKMVQNGGVSAEQVKGILPDIIKKE